MGLKGRVFFSLVRNKSGYLMFSEQRTFGTTWIRLYFTVKRGKFESPEVSLSVI